jgi:hypothetical protein
MYKPRFQSSNSVFPKLVKVHCSNDKQVKKYFGLIKSLFETIDSKMKVNSFCPMNEIACSCEEPSQEDKPMRAGPNQISIGDASQGKFHFKEGAKEGITKTGIWLQENIPI